MLEMRKLYPSLTDEALENRIARIVKELGEPVPEWAAESVSWLGRDMNRQITTTIADAKYVDGFENILFRLLKCLGETFLREAPDGSLRVHIRLLDIWHDMILSVPPALIQAAWLRDRIFRYPQRKLSRTELQATLLRIAQAMCDSTLPIDDDPDLDYLSRTLGFDEMHMHLNGTTEAEKVWMEALRAPKRVVNQLEHFLKRNGLRDSGLRTRVGNGVQRLLLQEDEGLTPKLLYSRIQDGAALRGFLLHHGDASLALQWRKIANKDDFFGSPTGVFLYRKASQSCLKTKNIPLIVREIYELCLILNFEHFNAMYADKLAFMHYALLRAQFYRLLVQQREQKGFDQFQYITLNELRESTERKYVERFRQIERREQRGIDFLEGRFAPKATPDQTAFLLCRILRGYLGFLREDPKEIIIDDEAEKEWKTDKAFRSLSTLLRTVRQVEASPSTKRRLRLGVVPHFIKRYFVDDMSEFFNSVSVRPLCRDLKLRRSVDKSARALVVLMKRVPDVKTFIRGVDAASNERHGSPEVFAPTYRRMRRAGVTRFTYHAGEDFVHLASGLRAISEAVFFLDLEAGCRVGHATAAGLSPERWWNGVCGQVVMPVGARIDDLVFALDLLIERQTCNASLALIEMELRSLASRVWPSNPPSVDVLRKAWRIRSLDPLALHVTLRDVDSFQRDEAISLRAAKDAFPDAYMYFLRYHGHHVAPGELQRASRPITISRESDVISVEVMKELQRAVLSILRARRIAIETLPSANVRISTYEHYNEHHALRWLGEGKSPLKEGVKVVVGSDNQGIFATNLRIEYAHLLRAMETEQEMGEGNNQIPIENIERMIRNGKIYRF